MTTSSGLDRIFGGDGEDVIRGGLDADRIKDGKGEDLVVGGDGDDRLISDTGAGSGRRNGPSDVLRGGLGNDDLRGSMPDVLYGGAGDDTLLGYILHGGPGLDTCTDPTDPEFQCDSAPASP